MRVRFDQLSDPSRLHTPFECVQRTDADAHAKDSRKRSLQANAAAIKIEEALGWLELDERVANLDAGGCAELRSNGTSEVAGVRTGVPRCYQQTPQTTRRVR